MKTCHLSALFLAAGFFWTCKPSPGPDASSTALTFEATTLERQSGPACQTEEGQCARIEMVYPLATDGNKVLAGKINDTLQTTLSNILLMLNPEGDSIQTPDQLADFFIASYASFLAEVPDYEMGWWIESSYEIHLNNPEIVSLELMVNSFSGGAHPLGFSETFNYSVAEARPLSLDELIQDKTGFLKLLEKEFKASRDLPQDANLADEGFFYGEPFALPSNFACTEEGLYFIYNVYEAAPYALGPTEFLIPYDKLVDFIHTDRLRP